MGRKLLYISSIAAVEGWQLLAKPSPGGLRRNGSTGETRETSCFASHHQDPRRPFLTLAHALQATTFLGSFVELLDMMDMASKLGFAIVDPIRLRSFLAKWSPDAYPTGTVSVSLPTRQNATA